MGKKQNLQVKNNYALYLQLLEQLKVAKSSPIYLSQKQDNAKYLAGQVDLDCPASEGVHLLAERNKTVLSHYGIKIRALNLCDAPIFRFDADGPTHSNNFDDIPLPQRQVTTPHFHRFREDGYEIAFKSEFLSQDPLNEREIQADMNVGMQHFSDEGKVRCADDSYPTVEEQERALFPPSDYDPLQGVSF